jgi:membrane protein
VTAWALRRLFVEAFRGWQKDNAPRLGAALAYYTLFSLAPLLVVAIAVAGVLFGQEAAQGRIVHELAGLVGTAGARAVEEMVANSRKPEAGLVATSVALVTLLIGASGVFGELRGALNVVWDVPEAAMPTGVLGFLRQRLASFAMVLAVGFLLIVSLVFSAALEATHGILGRVLPDAGVALHVFDALGSLLVVTLLFALLFKYLPDTRVEWRDVWFGALLTSVLFGAGKQLIGLYLGRGSFSSVYGAAGSVVVLVVWVYYASQIFLFGAELTQARARQRTEGVFYKPRGTAPAASLPSAT